MVAAAVVPLRGQQQRPQAAVMCRALLRKGVQQGDAPAEAGAGRLPRRRRAAPASRGRRPARCPRSPDRRARPRWPGRYSAPFLARSRRSACTSARKTSTMARSWLRPSRVLMASADWACTLGLVQVEAEHRRRRELQVDERARAGRAELVGDAPGMARDGRSRHGRTCRWCRARAGPGAASTGSPAASAVARACSKACPGRIQVVHALDAADQFEGMTADLRACSCRGQRRPRREREPGRPSLPAKATSASSTAAWAASRGSGSGSEQVIGQPNVPSRSRPTASRPPPRGRASGGSPPGRRLQPDASWLDEHARRPAWPRRPGGPRPGASTSRASASARSSGSSSSRPRGERVDRRSQCPPSHRIRPEKTSSLPARPVPGLGGQFRGNVRGQAALDAPLRATERRRRSRPAGRQQSPATASRVRVCRNRKAPSSTASSWHEPRAPARRRPLPRVARRGREQPPVEMAAEQRGSNTRCGPHSRPAGRPHPRRRIRHARSAERSSTRKGTPSAGALNPLDHFGLGAGRHARTMAATSPARQSLERDVRRPRLPRNRTTSSRG